jgi:hypothetical protein
VRADSLARVPVADPESFSWVEDGTVTYSEAGCLTLVAGLSATEALQRVGADLTQAASGPLGGGRVQGYSMISVHAAGSPDSSSAVLIEDNGYEGAQPNVLAALSRKGRAASVFWNVNGIVTFGCARRGKLVCSTELPDMPETLPRTLTRLMVPAAEDGPPLVAIAMAMAATFTGVAVEPESDLVDPKVWYPIITPILRLPVTAEELVGIGLPSHELVQQVKDADESSRRRLVEWSVRDCLTRVGLQDDPAADRFLAQFGTGQPITVGVELPRALAEAERQTDLAADRGQRLYNTGEAADWQRDAAGKEQTAWAYRMWALRAVIYTGLDDSVTAALGAAYCAAHSGADEAEFLAEAAAVLAKPA